MAKDKAKRPPSVVVSHASDRSGDHSPTPSVVSVRTIASTEEIELVNCVYDRCTNPRDARYNQYCVDHGPLKALQALTGAPNTPRVPAKYVYQHDPQAAGLAPAPNAPAKFSSDETGGDRSDPGLRVSGDHGSESDRPVPRMLLPRKLNWIAAASGTYTDTTTETETDREMEKESDTAPKQRVRPRSSHQQRERRRARSMHSRRRSRKSMEQLKGSLVALRGERHEQQQPQRQQQQQQQQQQQPLSDVRRGNHNVSLSDLTAPRRRPNTVSHNASSSSLQSARSARRRAQSPSGTVFDRLSHRSSFTGVPKVVASELEEKSASKGSITARSKKERSPNVFDRLASSSSYTGVAKKRLEERQSKSNLNRSESAASLGIPRAQTDAILNKVVAVLTCADPVADSAAELTELTKELGEIRVIDGTDEEKELPQRKWRDILNEMVSRHIFAQSRDLSSNSAKALTKLTSPSATSLVQELNDSVENTSLAADMSQLLQKAVLGSSMIHQLSSGRYSIRTGALAEHVFGRQQLSKVIDGSKTVIYELRIGGRPYVARFTPGGADPSIAARLLKYVRAALFSGTDGASRYELTQAMRTTPINQWKGTILQRGSGGKDAGDMQLTAQVKIFERSANFPLGLNTTVNAQLRKLLEVQMNSAVQQRLKELEVAQANIEELRQKVLKLREVSLSEELDDADMEEQIQG